jgi:hypothetical protein
MTGAQLVIDLRALLADLLGTYRDSDLGPSADRPAAGYGELPASVTATGLEVHVDDLDDLEVQSAYQHEVGIRRAWTVRLVAWDGTPPGALSSAMRRVVATYRTPAPALLPEDERLGIKRQAAITVTD